MTQGLQAAGGRGMLGVSPFCSPSSFPTPVPLPCQPGASCSWVCACPRMLREVSSPKRWAFQQIWSICCSR